MRDCFALLNEPRRPWLDPEALKQKFIAISKDVHPDRVHGRTDAERQAAQERYTELNAAYQCLREPRTRLQHLIELELGEKPADLQRVPPDLMNRFLEVGNLCREVDPFLVEKSSVTSPLLQVQMFERSQAWTERLNALQMRLTSWQNELSRELQSLDAAWDPSTPSDPAARRATLPRLEELARLFAYFARWSAQIQERIVQLSF